MMFMLPGHWRLCGIRDGRRVRGCARVRVLLRRVAGRVSRRMAVDRYHHALALRDPASCRGGPDRLADSDMELERIPYRTAFASRALRIVRAARVRPASASLNACDHPSCGFVVSAALGFQYSGCLGRARPTRALMARACPGQIARRGGGPHPPRRVPGALAALPTGPGSQARGRG